MKGILKTKCEKDLSSNLKRKKIMKSEVYKRLDERSHQWLECNLDLKKKAGVIKLQQQMVETRGWRKLKG